MARIDPTSPTTAAMDQWQTEVLDRQRRATLDGASKWGARKPHFAAAKIAADRDLRNNS